MARRIRSEALEQVAERFLERVGAGASPDAMELARRAGLVPLPGDVRRAELGIDGVLSYRADARPRDQQRWVSFQLAGHLLRLHDLDDSREATYQTAAALLLPREPFVRDAAEAGWNIRELRALYPNASIRTMAYRIVTLQPAALTWFDHGRRQWRSVHPAVRSRLAETTRYEQHLAEISLESDEVLNPEKRVWAFPLHRRLGMTMLLCDAERLLAKL